MNGVVYVDMNETDVGLGSPGDSGETLKKRKRNLRGIRPNVPNIDVALPSSRLPPPDDRTFVGLSITLSNLFSRHGVLQEQFYGAFHVCDDCKRIVSKETSMHDGHTCVIELHD